jgi:hypothetical protein
MTVEEAFTPFGQEARFGLVDDVSASCILERV